MLWDPDLVGAGIFESGSETDTYFIRKAYQNSDSPAADPLCTLIILSFYSALWVGNSDTGKIIPDPHLGCKD